MLASRFKGQMGQMGRSGSGGGAAAMDGL